MSKNLKYEEYSSKCLSGVDDEGRKVTQHTEKRVTRTTSNLSDSFKPRKLRYKHNDSFDDDVSSIGPSASCVNSRLSDNYHVSYPPTERSNITDEDLASNYSERTQNKLDDFDLGSFREDYVGKSRKDFSDDDDVFSVHSRKSDALSNSSRSRRRNFLKMQTPIENSLDEEMEDLSRGFNKNCSLREKMFKKHQNFFDDNLLHDDSFGLLQHSSMLSDGFMDDFFRNTVGILGKNTRKKSEACNSSFEYENTSSNTKPSRFKTLEQEDDLSYYDESGIFSETSDKKNYKIRKNDETTREYNNSNDNNFSTSNELNRNSQSDEDIFKLSIDVNGFKPNELLVRTEGNRLVVCAKVKDRKDYEKQTNKKITARNFRQEFDLPEGVNPYDVTSSLDSDGLLNIEAPITKHLVKTNSAHD